MICALEHANLSVTDVDAHVKFWLTAFPHFRVRGGGVVGNYAWEPQWVHVGTDHLYMTFSTVAPDYDETKVHRPYQGRPGLNHLCWVVDDLDGVRARLDAAGYRTRERGVQATPYRKRFYAVDPDGNDWEFVQYFTDDVSLRNEYIEGAIEYPAGKSEPMP
jgi:catechol 2,3-dioxygenase-like lactoylglutathione lyase family enzyme